jgi:hypothetical protein
MLSWPSLSWRCRYRLGVHGSGRWFPHASTGIVRVWVLVARGWCQHPRTGRPRWVVDESYTNLPVASHGRSFTPVTGGGCISPVEAPAVVVTAVGRCPSTVVVVWVIHIDRWVTGSNSFCLSWAPAPPSLSPEVSGVVALL